MNRNDLRKVDLNLLIVFETLMHERSVTRAAEKLFLGQPAPFPVGPWRMAAMLRRPVFFMTGLYLGGNRYQLHFEPLADFSQTPRADRDAAIRAAMQHYADRLTHYCRLAPYNWFNFFDFWQKK